MTLLLQAEVQAVHQDGVVLLHTRSTKYGLLKHGQLVQVSACLVKRQRQHLQTLDALGVDIVMGCNGLIWVGATRRDDEGDEMDIDLSQNTIIAIARVSQAIRTLSLLRFMISSESIQLTVERSLDLSLDPFQMGSKMFIEAICAEKFSKHAL